ncbi:MAG: DUF2283 domain-containing protein [Aquificales bacterium]|nr:DUF2283 domain-containing protein [Aquificales bacterium]
MKIRYFEDTDTLLIEFNEAEVWETVEINQSTYADYDRDGQVVTLTVEHAAQLTDVNSMLFAKVPA